MTSHVTRYDISLVGTAGTMTYFFHTFRTIVTEYDEVLSESLNLIYDYINLCYFCDVLIRIGVVAVLVGVQYAVARGVPIYASVPCTFLF